VKISDAKVNMKLDNP